MFLSCCKQPKGDTVLHAYTHARETCTGEMGRETFSDQENAGHMKDAPEPRPPPHLPQQENVYGSAEVALIEILAGRTWNFMHLLMIFFLLEFNIFAQFYILYRVRQHLSWPAIRSIRAVYTEYHQDVFANGTFAPKLWQEWAPHKRRQVCNIPFSKPASHLIIVCIWTCFCWTALKEVLNRGLIWHKLPPAVPPEEGEPHFERNVVLARDSDGVTIIVKRANTCVKLLVDVFILFPQIVIVGVLWWLGVQWLTATLSFKDIVLNVVALEFILNLDEIIFKAFLPQRTQDITKMYAIDKQESETGVGETGRRLVFVAAFVVVFALPITFIFRFQQVLPEYAWDTFEPCSMLQNINASLYEI